MLWWKFGRELKRILSQFRAIPEAFWEPIVQRGHENRFAEGLPIYEGDVDLNERIALLVVYQPAGLNASTLAKCKYLGEKGFAPFVVSNAPLSIKDCKALKAVTWKAMVRPNIGYDFGAYRDGLLSLKSWDILPERILMMNDSVWYPMAGAGLFLEQLQASDADVTGTVLRTHRKGSFLESYCYMLGRRCFETPEFWRYWTELRLTGNKYKVIRRGERDHSLSLRKAGLSMRSLFSKEVFLSEIAKFSDHELEQTLRFAAFVDPDWRRKNASFVAAQKGHTWHRSVLEHIGKSLEKTQFYSAFPYASMRIFSYPVLKASADPVAKAWRLAYLAAIEDGALQFPPEPVFSELRDKVAADVRTFERAGWGGLRYCKKLRPTRDVAAARDASLSRKEVT